MLRVKNKDTRMTVNFVHISHFVLVFLLLTSAGLGLTMSTINVRFLLILFFFSYSLTPKLDGNTLAKKAMFFQLENFVSKTIVNFYSFNRINGFVTTRYATTIFYPFHCFKYARNTGFH